MKLVVFSVLDKAVGAFLQPFFSRSKGEAIRSFTDAAGRPDEPFMKHPDDFVLYFIGEFDDSSGLFLPNEPQRVMSARECMSSS